MFKFLGKKITDGEHKIVDYVKNKTSSEDELESEEKINDTSEPENEQSVSEDSEKNSEATDE